LADRGVADCRLAAFGNAAERLVIRRLVFVDRRVGCVEVLREVGVAVRAVVRPVDP
jgi:hypothetical protein